MYTLMDTVVDEEISCFNQNIFILIRSSDRLLVRLVLMKLNSIDQSLSNLGIFARVRPQKDGKQTNVCYNFFPLIESAKNMIYVTKSVFFLIFYNRRYFCSREYLLLREQKILSNVCKLPKLKILNISSFTYHNTCIINKYKIITRF